MILIVGGTQDFETKESKALTKYFDKKGLVYEYIKQSSEFDYNEIEAQIEKCDIFLVLISSELDSSTWLLHCLYYVCMESNNKPKMIAFRIKEYKIIPSIKSLEKRKDMEIFSTIGALKKYMEDSVESACLHPNNEWVKKN